jgi:hypothetical protein
MPPLDERYSKLLFAYPDDYRERHEAEMVSTLLDVARPGQRFPSCREAAGLVVGGLRTRARWAVSEGPRAVWWDGMRLAAALLISVQLGLSITGFMFFPYLRPHLLPLALGLTVIALMRRPGRFGLALVAADVVITWPAPLPYLTPGSQIVSPLVTLGQIFQTELASLLAFGLAAVVFAAGPGPRRSSHVWSWWLVTPILLGPALMQLLIYRYPGGPPPLLLFFSIDGPMLLAPIALGMLSVLARDPRPSIGAAIYLAVVLGGHSRYLYWAPTSVLLPCLLAVCVAAVVATSRRRAST